MRGGKKGDLFYALDQVRRAGLIAGRTLRRSQELLDDKPAEAVPDQDQRTARKRRFGQDPGENVRCLVREMHRRPT
jgi:hypothetical protein